MARMTGGRDGVGRLGWLDAWPRSAAKPTGPWTVTDGRRFGLLDPERGSVDPLDPLADRRLPGVGRAVAERNGVVVGYRYRRRSVVRHDGGFTKVVRPSSVDDLVARHAVGAAVSGCATPAVLEAASDGVVDLHTLSGPSLHERIRRGAPLELDRVAASLAAFHQAPPSTDALLATSADDPARWSVIVGRGEPAARPPVDAVAARLPVLDVGGGCLVHGDLHDKNVMVGDRVGLIDLDQLSIGAPELDVANLAVHLELRAMQSGRGHDVGVAWSAALIGAYRRHAELDDQLLADVAQHTWFRLACLYRFRRGGRALADALLARAALVNVPVSGQRLSARSVSSPT